MGPCLWHPSCPTICSLAWGHPVGGGWDHLGGGLGPQDWGRGHPGSGGGGPQGRLPVSPTARNALDRRGHLLPLGLWQVG